MTTKEHWIDYIKFDIQNDYKIRQESIILTITLISASFFIYNLIFSIYRFNIIAIIFCTLILIIAIIDNLGEILWEKVLSNTSFKKTIGSLKYGYLFLFILYFLMIIISYLFYPIYFQLMILILPLLITLRYGGFFVLRYIDLFFRMPYKDGLLRDIINGDIPKKHIYLYLQKVNKASLKEIILGILKSAIQEITNK